jgi:hypothetical protein
MAKLSDLRRQVPECGVEDASFLTVRELVRASTCLSFPSANAHFKAHSDDVVKKKALASLHAKSSLTGFRAPVVPTIASWRASLPTLRSDARSVGFAHIRAIAVRPVIGSHAQKVDFLTVPRHPGFRLPPEAVAWVRASSAFAEGDATLLRQFVEDQLGRPPDELLVGVLEQYFLPHARSLPSRIILDLLDHHRRRLNWNNPEEWCRWLAEQVYRRLKKDPNHRLMKALEHNPGSPHEKLKSELRCAVAQAEREGLFGGYFGNPYSRHNAYMLGDVEKQIVYANRLLKDTRSRQKHNEDERDGVVSLEALSWYEEEQFLSTRCKDEESEEFARLEEERERRRDELSKRLSPKEQELIRFIIFLRDNPGKHDDSIYEAASRHLGKAPSTIRKQIYDITQFLAS